MATIALLMPTQGPGNPLLGRAQGPGSLHPRPIENGGAPPQGMVTLCLCCPGGRGRHQEGKGPCSASFGRGDMTLCRGLAAPLLYYLDSPAEFLSSQFLQL